MKRLRYYRKLYSRYFRWFYLKKLGYFVPFLLLILISGYAVIALILYIEETSHPRSEFANYQQLSESGLIAEGWLPEYFPQSAYDIVEEHDLDTKNVWATFKYVPPASSPANKCRLIQHTESASKYFCPPYKSGTSILILRADGTGFYGHWATGM